MKKILLFILFTFLISSCFWSDDKDYDENTNNSGSLDVSVSKVPEFKKTDVKTNLDNWVLSVWENVKISEWRSEDFPQDIWVIEWWKIYKNSNIKWYAFVVVDWKTIKDIYNYYVNNLTKLWWGIDVENSDEQEVILQSLKDENNFDINLSFLKDNKSLDLKISNIIPEVLKNNLKLDWKFVEFEIY